MKRITQADPRWVYNESCIYQASPYVNIFDKPSANWLCYTEIERELLSGEEWDDANAVTSEIETIVAFDRKEVSDKGTVSFYGTDMICSVGVRDEIGRHAVARCSGAADRSWYRNDELYSARHAPGADAWKSIED